MSFQFWLKDFVDALTLKPLSCCQSSDAEKLVTDKYYCFLLVHTSIDLKGKATMSKSDAPLGVLNLLCTFTTH